MNFEEYLISKKIDAAAFEKAEPMLFHSWKVEFDQLHVNSFTVQKLNLLNPIRRKYQRKETFEPVKKQEPAPTSAPTEAPPAGPSQPRVARPVYKPKTT